ncbi:hypothetical protein [Trichlorobacter ammonificans]|uniref:Glycosyl transferase n=1 Tax=Trichlorobacter ammonificans TaxID=2916410 RepID=A0ABM9D5K4_9BACT|nr:hypothetical protein [Trichlorobacter ammonificans]CAH2030482.1 conserved protein of unknown function [Trichlorobacter ammonificans]
MLTFCTLFDANYLTRGLALYHSLRTHSEAATLYVYCFDKEAHTMLSRLALPGLVPVSLEEFETPELLAVKPNRSRGEYCWTCTAHTIRDALTRFSLPAVTYLDADLFFFQTPALLLDEFQRAEASVLLTEHRYTPRYDQSAASGRYCVQFMTFVADPRGLTTLDWWCDRTLEWCFNRHEDGKFGDQKYLDDWTERFSGVHVLQHTGGGVAPWNVQQYRIGPGPSVNGEPVVFYHFHNLTWCADDVFLLDRYRISRGAVDHLYRPYMAALRNSLREVRALFPDFSRGLSTEPRKRLAPWKRLEHRLKGKHHVLR